MRCYLTLETVHQEIENFLSEAAPGVLCIRGRWGVGKTYQWNQMLSKASQENAIPFRYYSYVSLFGVNTLAEFKISIFEGQRPLKTDEDRVSIERIDRLFSSKAEWRKKMKFLSFVPGLSGINDKEAAAALASLTIREQLICVDDIERRGRDLDVKDVLGLVSFLKEQQACKIVVIVNEEELQAQDQQMFRENLEKVVDISLAFNPTAEEAASSAFDKPDDISKSVIERSVRLGITNIRVIRRIDRLARSLYPLVEKYSPEVFDSALSSLALFTWANDQPNEAPSIEFIRSLSTQWAVLASDDEFEGEQKDEVVWRSKLEEYGYKWTDEFDLCLLDGVLAGYFSAASIEPHAKEFNDRVLAIKADGSFEQAWEAYHGSFDDNADQVLDGIYAAFKKNFHHITPLNVNGTVTLLKELGREEQANELIKLYVEGRNEEHGFFDLREYAFSHEITDPDLIKAFDDKVSSMKPRQDFKAALLSARDGWNKEQLEIISNARVQEYTETFKNSSGDELRRLLSNAMQFARIANPSPEMSKIVSNTKAALQEIGRESAINARRVRRFGIEITDK